MREERERGGEGRGGEERGGGEGRGLRKRERLPKRKKEKGKEGQGGEVGDGGGEVTLHLLHCITYCYFTDF